MTSAQAIRHPEADDMADQRRPPDYRTLQKLSVLHVVSGVLSITIAVIAVITIAHNDQVPSYGFTYVAAGTWCGFIFLIAGFFTYLLSSSRGEGFKNSSFIVSASSTVFAGAMFSLELATCLILASQNFPVAIVIVHSLLAVIACLEIGVSAITLAYCCKTHCCPLSIFIPQVKFISGSDSVPFVSGADQDDKNHV